MAERPLPIDVVQGQPPTGHADLKVIVEQGVVVLRYDPLWSRRSLIVGHSLEFVQAGADCFFTSSPKSLSVTRWRTGGDMAFVGKVAQNLSDLSNRNYPSMKILFKKDIYR